jgi:hypothetical protein
LETDAAGVGDRSRGANALPSRVFERKARREARCVGSDLDLRIDIGRRFAGSIIERVTAHLRPKLPFGRAAARGLVAKLRVGLVSKRQREDERRAAERPTDIRRRPPPRRVSVRLVSPPCRQGGAFRQEKASRRRSLHIVFLQVERAKPGDAPAIARGGRWNRFTGKIRPCHRCRPQPTRPRGSPEGRFGPT